MSEQSLVIFKAISNFVRDLNECFGTKQRSLQLYARLISKTTIEHEQAIEKHVECFKQFCMNNKDAISNKNYKEFIVNEISYSEKVHINLKEIFELASGDDYETIWKHILVIYTYFDPSSKAKELLKESLKASDKGDNNTEQEFISDIINKVETCVNPNSNPMEAVSSIMSSGLFTELIGGMNNGIQSGDLNLGRLMNTVQSMVGKLSTMTSGMDGMEGLDDVTSSLSRMMGSQGLNRKQKKKLKKKLKKHVEGSTSKSSKSSKSTSQPQSTIHEENEHEDVENDEPITESKIVELD